MMTVFPGERGKREGGQSSVLVCGALLVLLALGGLTIDGSRAFLLRRELQNAVDAAVIAGAGRVSLERWQESRGTSLEPHKGQAISVATAVFYQNAPEGSRATFRVRNTTVDGEAACKIEFLLLSLLGISGYEVRASASASPALITGR